MDRLKGVLTLLIVGGLVLAAFAAKALELDIATIVAANSEDSWSLSILLEGSSDITSATVQVPDAGFTVLTLECYADESVVSCLIMRNPNDRKRGSKSKVVSKASMLF